MKNRFEALLVALAGAGVEFVVAGGVAAVLQGVERVTLDLDVAINFSDKNVAAFLGVMHRLGFTPRAPVPPEIIADATARKRMVAEKNAIVFTFQDRSDPFWQVDVLLRDDLSYDRLREDCDLLEVSGQILHVLSKRKLLAAKLNIHPPRPKDEMDIAMLRRLLEDGRA